MLYIDQIADRVNSLLLYRLIIDDNSIVKIAPLDQPMLKECFNFAYEYECTRARNFLAKVLKIIKNFKLIGKHR